MQTDNSNFAKLDDFYTDYLKNIILNNFFHSIRVNISK